MAPGKSAIEIQRDVILNAIREVNDDDSQWKVLVVDDASRKILDNVIDEDKIIDLNITNIEQIEHKRPVNDLDALYLLSPEPHIVDCLMADFEHRRYKRAFLMWTALLDPQMRRRIDNSQMARGQIALSRTLSINFFPRESHLITFRDPYSFPILYHPDCNNLVMSHMKEIAQKITGICIAMNEYPTVRYYSPQYSRHEASVLCLHLARFVQEELDAYKHFHLNFATDNNRPPGTLLIVDRSLDIAAPFVHEFTYQAMAHDLLPIREGDKVMYKAKINEGQHDEEEKDMEVGEADKLWVDNRHRHMKDAIERLENGFRKFVADNPNFTQNTAPSKTSLNDIKDMLFGLPEFQTDKQAYSLHFTLASDCMKIFADRKLPELASAEQTLATGLDDEYKKPKNIADQVVRTLDEPSIAASDRLRLIALYLLYRDGLVEGDIHKLLAHAQLPLSDGRILDNLALLGARVRKLLQDNKPPPPPIFAPRKPPANDEDYGLSRFDPAVKIMLEELNRGSLDTTSFPYVKPPENDGLGGRTEAYAQSSLRSAKPTWVTNRSMSTEPRQRIIVFIAGGATYAEARGCYEISNSTSREVFLATSHMVNPALFLRQVGDLSVDRRRLNIPADRPKPRAPSHLFEPEPRPVDVSNNTTSGRAQKPPTASMAAMSLGSGSNINGTPSSGKPAPSAGGEKLKKREKEKEKEKEEKKKKHHFFSSSKK